MGSFSSLQIGTSALHAQRRGLDVTGHNVANANTEGYSRQRVEHVADGGPVTPAVHARWSGTGRGVRSEDVTRIRDQFLEARSHLEHATAAALEQEVVVLARIEGVFGEPADTGIAAVLADFWGGWDDVANHPEDTATASQLLERASMLAAAVNSADDQLRSLADDALAQLDVVVAQANDTAARVAQLNDRIRDATNAGAAPNDLMDQRDLLVADLARTLGATTRAGEGGAVDVLVGGTALVRGSRSEALERRSGSPAGVVWQKDGSAAPAGGEVGGLLEVANDVVPRYRRELREMVDTLRTQVNERYAPAGDLGAPPPFFVPTGDRLAVHPGLLDGSTPFVPGGTGGGTYDGSRAASVAALGSDDGSSGLVTADDRYRQLIVGLGVQAQSSNRRHEIQAAILGEVDAAREGVAGVDLDEEMTNMVAYQHAYNAAARFVTTIDEALDTIINGTGRVGR